MVASPIAKEKQIYEWRIYTLNGDSEILDRFFKETLIPAYNRQNISAGAFTLYKKEEKEKRFLLFVYPSLETYRKVRNALLNDEIFREEALSFFNETAPNPVYSEYTTFLCEAFDKIPVMKKPDNERTLFEFRLYHSPNEDANQRKIKMFNTEEIDLFDKVGINSVCYGEIMAGSSMPALIYLTWYKDEETRNEAWKKFGAHPDWAVMKKKSEYSNTATNNQSILLEPLPYSQF
jgi:hypothetical protein